MQHPLCGCSSSLVSMNLPSVLQNSRHCNLSFLFEIVSDLKALAIWGSSVVSKRTMCVHAASVLKYMHTGAYYTCFSLILMNPQIVVVITFEVIIHLQITLSQRGTATSLWLRSLLCECFFLRGAFATLLVWVHVVHLFENTTLRSLCRGHFCWMDCRFENRYKLII